MLTDVNVTKVDDPVLQRHEVIGGPLRIKAHTHDKIRFNPLNSQSKFYTFIYNLTIVL